MRNQCRWIVGWLLLAPLAVQAHADCGLRCGGCSDPCIAYSTAGGVSSCSGCAMVAAGNPCGACGSVSYPALQTYSNCLTSGGTSYAAPLGEVAVPPPSTLLGCGPVQSYKVVMEPEYFTETKLVPTTEYQDEIRYRTRTVPRQVKVEYEDYRTTTELVSKTETKTVEYSVLVPKTEEKTVDLVETVPVWNEVIEDYTVRVPTVVEVPEEYTVRIPQLRDEDFTYTVYVPQSQTQTKVQTVTNAVPVVKTRTVQVSRPVVRMETVTRDYGRWEVRVEEVAHSAYSMPTPSTPSLSCSGISTGGCGVYSGSCGACGGCGRCYSRSSNGCRTATACGVCGGCGVTSYSRNSGLGTICDGNMAETAVSCGTSTVSRRVWVPNVVTEEVPVTEMVTETQVVSYTAFEQQTEQIPYECTYLVYVPEQRTGTRKVVEYVDETRTRTRKVVEYNEEARTRTRKELSYKQETKTQTVPYVTYTTENRTKEVSYVVKVPETKVEPITRTRYDTVNEEITEEYTVRVPVASAKEVQVQVCRMVPKLVPTTIYPCCGDSGVGSGTSMGYPAGAVGCGGCQGGCAGCSGTPTVAPPCCN